MTPAKKRDGSKTVKKPPAKKKESYGPFDGYTIVKTKDGQALEVPSGVKAVEAGKDEFGKVNFVFEKV